MSVIYGLGIALAVFGGIVVIALIAWVVTLIGQED